MKIQIEQMLTMFLLFISLSAQGQQTFRADKPSPWLPLSLMCHDDILLEKSKVILTAIAVNSQTLSQLEIVAHDFQGRKNVTILRAPRLSLNPMPIGGFPVMTGFIHSSKLDMNSITRSGFKVVLTFGAMWNPPPTYRDLRIQPTPLQGQLEVLSDGASAVIPQIKPNLHCRFVKPN